jgi:hypothetical protein
MKCISFYSHIFYLNRFLCLNFNYKNLFSHISVYKNLEKRDKVIENNNKKKTKREKTSSESYYNYNE